MASLRRFSIVTVVGLLSFFSLPGQGYRITVRVLDLPSADLILAHRFGMKFYTDDTVRTQGDGSALFSSGTLMPQGMYQIVFPDKKYIEFFLGDQQVFEISTEASGSRDKILFNGSPENASFNRWQTRLSSIRSQSSLLQEKIRKGNLSADSVLWVNKELRTLNAASNQIWETALNELRGTVAGKFISGMKPIRMPDSLASQRTQEGQMKQYRYVREHFFDDVDLADERMLRTPLIETKLDQYFNQVVPPYPDTIIRDAVTIIERSRSHPEVFHFVLQYLFNLYSDPKIMGTDAVYVYLAENYYLKGQAPWIDSTNLKGILVRVAELKPLLLGNMAPELSGLVNTDDIPVEIDTIKCEYLVLLFWDPGCSHCKIITPQLYQEYQALKLIGCEIAAINTHAEKEPWIKFISEHHLDWYNLYSPLQYRQLIEQYQVYTTPRIFVLDSERKIAGKDLAVEQIKPFIEQIRASRSERH